MPVYDSNLLVELNSILEAKGNGKELGLEIHYKDGWVDIDDISLSMMKQLVEESEQLGG
ncbi:MAG: hypothetical protein IH947_11680 [Bacteroidetes bacterium]|nr:hypothetical protein [Bacteroidota bacterium]